MKLKNTLFLAIILAISFLSTWEMYWRSEGYYPNYDDNKDMWAVERSKVENTTKEDVVVIGASRILFDLQLDEWENATGRRPIQLASVGSSALPALRDLVQNTEFAGTLIIGVTPGLFFSTVSPNARPFRKPQSKVDYYYSRTYAQRINHRISMLLQGSLVLMSATYNKWYDDIDLKALLSRIHIGNRVGKGSPPFRSFYDIETDRNVTMNHITATDTAFANSIKKVWSHGKPSKPKKEETMNFFLDYAKIFVEKGGNLILVRSPSTGPIREGENTRLPREQFWDVLIEQSDAVGYHFEDYEVLKNFDCPEWSHLSADDARLFTLDYCKQSSGNAYKVSINKIICIDIALNTMFQYYVHICLYTKS